MKTTLVALLATASLAVAGAAQASVAALTGWTDGFRATSGSDQLYGWYFDTSAAIAVDGLGVGDTDSDGLVISHDVGIFRLSDQALMGSATVGAGTGGTLVNGFRYAAASFNLAAGSYVIVMTMPYRNGDSQLIGASSPTTSSPVSYVNSAFDNGSSLAFPNPGSTGAFAEGLFGPNFTFDLAGGGVPEPATWAMMLAGFGLGGAALRRRRALAA